MASFDFKPSWFMHDKQIWVSFFIFQWFFTIHDHFFLVVIHFSGFWARQNSKPPPPIKYARVSTIYPSCPFSFVIPCRCRVLTWYVIIVMIILSDQTSRFPHLFIVEHPRTYFLSYSAYSSIFMLTFSIRHVFFYTRLYWRIPAVLKSRVGWPCEGFHSV